MANTRNELHDARSMAIAGVCIFLAPTGFFPAQASSIDGIYAFGDSLTDVATSMRRPTASLLQLRIGSTRLPAR
jgi:hypothetical protein